MKKWVMVMLTILLFVLSACGQSMKVEEEKQNTLTESEEKPLNFPQLTKDQTSIMKAEMTTNKGTIVIELYPEQAPKAVENFVTLSKKGYYNGLIFHRVIDSFMIQGGDPLGNGTGGESAFGGSFEDEFSRELYNFRGALSMANSGPNTNGSQFFIVQAPAVDEDMLEQMKEAGYPQEAIDGYEDLGGTPWLDGRHTVFGQVIEGMNVVDDIASSKVGAGDKPVYDITIEAITITEE